MNAFICGSRAYGTPRPDSDVDLVVLVSAADMLKLAELSECANPNITRFGRLNLIPVTSEIEFAAWRLGTEELCRKKAAGCPQGKTEGARVLDDLLAKVGIVRIDPSGE
jgi:hypothetical protein